MAAIAEVMSKPNLVSAARLVQADAGALIDGPQLPTTAGNDRQVMGRVEACHSSAMLRKDWVDETLMRFRGKDLDNAQ